MSLPGFQRRFLRSQAHPLRPVVIVGKSGVTGALLAKVDAELTAHELIKIRFSDHKESRKSLAAAIATQTRSELAGTVGNVAILYRPSADPDYRRLRLPERAE